MDKIDKIDKNVNPKSSIVNRKSKIVNLLIAALIGFNACGDWIDVVPDGVATRDMAFKSREQSLGYLATCYAYMVPIGNLNRDPAMLGGDELWTVVSPQPWFRYDGLYLAQGMLNATNPLFDNWGYYYQALRNCNIFLENIGSVPDLPELERDKWIAEVKVLKAWYHFCLVRQYGPVPIIRENIPVSADVSKVKTVREPVDDCFRYIVELLDEAVANDRLPSQIADVAEELGRITLPIALALKAKILVTAASPLYNGNTGDEAGVVNRDGTPLFNSKYEEAKWQKAMVACKEAIDACYEADIRLYEFPNTGNNKLTDTIATQMSLRNAFTLRWNSEIIWANTQSIIDANMRSVTGTGLQSYAGVILNPDFIDNMGMPKHLGVPMKIAAMFYTDNGVPLTEDKTRNINDIYNLRTGRTDEKLYIKSGYVTADLHFDREPRFYAWVGFDGGIWYGAGRTDDKADLWHLEGKSGETDRLWQTGVGYLPKKYIHYTNMVTNNQESSSITRYPWVMMRLSDLYLLYAEAVNEAEGPNGANSADLFFYINEVRKRAGLEGVKESWGAYSKTPTKYNSPAGMRDIIRQERMIELAFEGNRFWDVRRWQIAPDVYAEPIDGWTVNVSETNAFYMRRVVYQKEFRTREYFWPIRNSELDKNPNLVQNVGW